MRKKVVQMAKPWQNGEGYADPTAYEGLKPVIREETEQQQRGMKLPCPAIF